MLFSIGAHVGSHRNPRNARVAPGTGPPIRRSPRNSSRARRRPGGRRSDRFHRPPATRVDVPRPGNVEHEHLHEMTGVQAGRGGIEPGIESERSRFEIRRNASRSVDCAISPRQDNSSRMCSLTVPFSPHFTTDRRGDRNKHDRRPTPTATTPSGPHAGTGVTPIGADRRRTGDPEPPRHVPSGGDPHTRPRPDRLRSDRLPGEEPDGRVGIREIEAVVDAIETENGGQHGRPFGDCHRPGQWGVYSWPVPVPRRPHPHATTRRRVHRR